MNGSIRLISSVAVAARMSGRRTRGSSRWRKAATAPIAAPAPTTKRAATGKPMPRVRITSVAGVALTSIALMSR